MLVLLSRFLIVSLILAFQGAQSAGYAVAERGVEAVFKAGKYKRSAQLVVLGANDLSHASKAENIHGLLELAEAENRIDTVHMLQYSRLYSKMDGGDHLLLTCLKVSSCNPEQFLKIRATSGLHAEIALRRPDLGMVQVGHAVGAINENLMVRFFTSSGWESVPGQIGRQGIDGLFVKREGGLIKEVMVVESKYNTSMLQPTNHGIQMSEQWVKRKIFELKTAYPNNRDYVAIGRFVDSGSYRAILWNLKVEDGALMVGLKKVRSKGGSIDISPVDVKDQENSAALLIKEIKILQPKNDFESEFVGWYKRELTQYEHRT